MNNILGVTNREHKRGLKSYGFHGLRPMHPELEVVGPAKFDVSKLLLFKHPKSGFIDANTEYERLKEKNMLKFCFGLYELYTFQDTKKGVVLFDKYFGSVALLGWKSVAKNKYDGKLYVPALTWNNGPMLYWYHFDQPWEDRLRIPHFENNSF